MVTAASEVAITDVRCQKVKTPLVTFYDTEDRYQYFENEDFIISLASQEFTSMIKHPSLYFIDFIEIKNNKIKRNAMIIKKARGMMLNQMILKEIKTLNELMQLNIDGFQYCSQYSQNQVLAFVREVD